jgi:hypothetical protein
MAINYTITTGTVAPPFCLLYNFIGTLENEKESTETISFSWQKCIESFNFIAARRVEQS